ncbi:YqhG family protein [Paenibacillus sp. P96]|uniref:YqhG family protein n=1 Tax=Paenibacillus zeirhizosphaerae TaxID=2987519 RepID=A0ABT9FSH0_9BACL|nr:YqhG family protein [Paenibacillus sp. P96]MDP4097679.1 YqhG family protein [Paenibacillus sp. P96]
MSMSTDDIHCYVMSYLRSTGCSIIEKSPAHVTVKLSPEADKALTNRPYYWGYVERTGVPPETMSYTFVFDPAAYEQLQQAAPPVDANPDPNRMLARYFGTAPALPQLGPNRILREDVSFGSRRLQQIFAAAREGGRYVNLFEQADPQQLDARRPVKYEPWLGGCFKVEFVCDVKREELHFLGISMRTGQIEKDFGKLLVGKELSPQLAGNMHIPPVKLPLAAAVTQLESYLIEEIRGRDYRWSELARERLAEELAMIDLYYEDLLKEPDETKRTTLQEQHNARRQEMSWQYEPKVLISAINCGLFHLR